MGIWRSSPAFTEVPAPSVPHGRAGHASPLGHAGHGHRSHNVSGSPASGFMTFITLMLDSHFSEHQWNIMMNSATQKQEVYHKYYSVLKSTRHKRYIYMCIYTHTVDASEIRRSPVSIDTLSHSLRTVFIHPSE